MAEQRVVTSTKFHRNDGGSQWYWTTRGANGEPVGGSAGEGFDELRGAVNGFFAQQGLPGWEPQTDPATQFVIPEGYSGQVVDVDTYVVVKYETTV